MLDDTKLNILEALPFAVIWVNNQGIVEWLNQEAMRILDAQWQGYPWHQVMESCFKDLRLDGFEVATQNGQLLQVYLSTVEQCPGQLITLVDVTSSRVLQRHLAHQQRIYSIGQMTAQLAHQIRTPLASALLLAERISDRVDNEKCRQLLDKLKGCHHSIERQISDLLAYCRGEPLTMEPFNLQHWLMHWQSTAKTYFEQCKAELDMDFDFDPATQIEGNQEALSGCLFNLLENALQAESSCINIKVYPIWDSLIAIDFQDNGKGMSKTLVEKARDPFFTTKAKGTGLGLAVVESVINQHAGTVTFESGDGKGFFVRFILPVKDDKKG